MNTTYYTFTTWDGSAIAAGQDGAARQSVILPQPRRGASLGGDNVICLDAWRAANPEPLPSDPSCGDGPEDACPEQDAPAPFVPRARRRRRVLFAGELASTLGVLAVLAALLIRVLIF